MNQGMLKPVPGLLAPSHALGYRMWLIGASIVVAGLCFVGLAFVAHTTLVFNFDIPVTLAVQQFNPSWLL